MLYLFLTSVFAEPNDNIDPKIADQKIVNPKKKDDETCSGKNLEGIKPTLSPNSNNEKREGNGCNSK